MGVGGVGGTIAASLATAGTCESVTCVARGIGLDTIRKSGLRLTLHDGQDVTCKELTAVEARAAATSAAGHQDVIFLTTKAHQILGVLDVVAPMVNEHTTIVPLQNGLPWWFFCKSDFRNPPAHTTLASIDPGAAIYDALPPSQVVGAVGFVAGATSDEGTDRVWFDGKVRGKRRWYSKWPPERSTITLGEIGSAPNDGSGSGSSSGSSGGSGGGSSGGNGNGGSGGSGGSGRLRARDVADLFASSVVRLPTLVVEDIHSAVLSKLLVNASINTLSALGRCDCGELTASPGLREALRTICAEVEAVAAALDPPVRLTTDAEAVLELYGGQYGLRSSMLQDLEAGRPLEHAAIVNAILEVGELAGRGAVKMPALTMVGALLDQISPPGSGSGR